MEFLIRADKIDTLKDKLDALKDELIAVHSHYIRKENK
jgi:hypothetical protein